MGGYRLPEPTGGQGHFTFPADQSYIHRYPITVVDASNATMNGQALGAEQQSALAQATGGINVMYEVADVATAVREDGAITVTGRLQFGNGDAPPPVVLYSYRLEGTAVDTEGQPVEGMTVGTNSPEFRWTFSQPTDAQGEYTSLLWPTDPGAFNVLLIDNDKYYPLPDGEKVRFPLYASARLDVTLDRSTDTISVTEPVTIPGHIFDALLVGVLQDGAPVKPVSMTWPTEQGRFQIVLPASSAGKTLTWWQWETNFFSAAAADPGGPVNLSEWPTVLGPHTPRGMAKLELPARP